MNKLISFFSRENTNLFISSIILASICTIITYPGIYYPDTYETIDYADHIINILINNDYNATFETHILKISAYIVTLFKLMFKDLSVYTFTRAFIYFFVSFLLIKKINSPYKIVQYILFIVNPIFLCVSVWLIPGLITTISLGIIFILLTMNNIKNFHYVILFFAVFFLFGYRTNSYTVLPLILLYVLSYSAFSKKNIIIIISVIFSSIVLLLFIPAPKNTVQVKLYEGGFVWETVDVINNLKSPTKEQLSYLDDIGGSGSTINTVNLIRKENESLSIFIWDKESGLSIYNMSKGNNPKLLMKKYFKIIKEHPYTYIQVKLHFIKRVLGIGTPLNCPEYDYNRWNKMSEYNFNDSAIRQHFCDLFNYYAKTYSIIRFPYIMFIFTLFLLLFELLCKSKKMKIYLFLYGIAIFYYSAFLITTHSFEIRYYFPSFYFMYVMNIAIICDLFKVIKNKLNVE